MPARLMTIASVAALMSGTVLAQGVGGVDARVGQYGSGTAYVYASSPELLGGPVRQPGEIRIASERGNAGEGLRHQPRRSTVTWTQSTGSTDAVSVGYEEPQIVLTEAYRASQSSSGEYVRPGTQVQSTAGTPLGRIELVEKAPSGVVNTAWVRPPNSNSASLKQVRIRSVTYANGEFVAVAG
ncbi:MAG: hypothetical protein RLN72_16155 [Henriciella sp.]